MFRVLSLDGGGIRGAFIASCLAELQQHVDKPLVEYFDLIAGTSTGGIIATLMASGVPIEVIKDIYATKAHLVFKPSKAYFSGVYRPISWSTSPFLELFSGITTDELVQAKYTNSGLSALLNELIGDKRLGEIDSTRLLITAVDLINGKPVIFKTPHLPFLYHDNHRRCKDIILATSAAPTYFNPVPIESGTAFCDGGLWANNPAVVAFSEAVHIGGTCHREVDTHFAIEEINILSIGTGFTHYSHIPPEEGAGFKWWARRTMEIMLYSQSQSTCFLLNRMLGDRFYRIDYELPSPDWARMDNLGMADAIIALGVEEGAKNAARVKEIFLNEPAHPYVPYTETHQSMETH